MGKNAMAGAVTLCGVGLCMIGGAMLMQSGRQAHAAGGVMPAAAALASAASAQAGPTVVWYGVSQGGDYHSVLYRAWSDGSVEGIAVNRLFTNCAPGATTLSACGGWQVLSSPNQGFKAAADINADEFVDGADLASVLGNWGDAPRVPFPRSDCPLNLINP